MQREFINVAAYELRTPTQAIIGYSDLFYLRPESREEAIKAIARNAEHLERLTHDILDVTRIEGHRFDLATEKFDISEVVASVIEDTKRRVHDKESAKFQYIPRKILVEADRTRISQVVSNLLGNAVKFTKQGMVYISADIKDGQVIVSVKDSGAGVDPDIMSRLFIKSQVNPRPELALDYLYLKALSKHMVVEFGLKTIRIVKVQRSPLEWP